MSDTNKRPDVSETSGFWAFIDRRPWVFALVTFLGGAAIVELAATPFRKTSDSPYAPGLSGLEIALLAYTLPLVVLAVILMIAEGRQH